MRLTYIIYCVLGNGWRLVCFLLYGIFSRIECRFNYNYYKAPARGRFLVGARGLVGLVEADAGYVGGFDGIGEIVNVL